MIYLVTDEGIAAYRADRAAVGDDNAVLLASAALGDTTAAWALDVSREQARERVSKLIVARKVAAK